MSITPIFRATNLLRGSICLLIAIGVGAIGLQLGHWLRPVATSVPAPTAVLVVDPSHLSIGEVWETNAFELTLPIRNVTDEAIEIDRFSTSCDCTKITPDHLRIPANEVREIRLALDFVSRKASNDDSSRNQNFRDFAATIQAKVKDLDPRRLEEWTGTGRVRSAVRLDVSEISFDSRSRLARSSAPKTAIATNFVRLERLTATSSLPNLLVTVDRADGGARGYRIDVCPRTAFPVGSFRASIRIVPHLAGRVKLPAMELPVTGQVLPDIQANPPSMAFGVQKIGAELQESFTLSSRTGSAFEVRSVQATGEGMTVSKRADPSDGVVYLIRQKIAKADDRRGAIVLEIKAADGTTEKLTVEATHYGISPDKQWGR